MIYLYDPVLTALVLTVTVAMVPLVFMLYIFLIRKAMFTVIQAFRKHNALEEGTAKTLKELGLMPRHFFDPFKPAMRDYKPQALQSLIMHDIVQITADQKLYLSEEALLKIMSPVQPQPNN